MMAKEKKNTRGGVKTLAEFDKVFANNIRDPRVLARNAGYWPTGSILVDKLLGGGFPRGTMVEVWGKPQSGKSTLAMKAAGLVLKRGGKVAYCDLERGLDLHNEDNWSDDGQLKPELVEQAERDPEGEHAEKRQSWLRINGINAFDKNFRILDPDNGEQMFEMLDEVVANNLFDMVIVDSVAAIITRREQNANAGESGFGTVASLMSVELKRLVSLYRDNPNTTILWINQVRENIGAQVKSLKSFGGNALEHFVGTKVRVSKLRREESGTDIITESQVRVDKSRYASARTVNIMVSGQRGLDTLDELLAYAVDFGYVHQAGAWYTFFSDPVEKAVVSAAKKPEDVAGFLVKLQGRAAALDWMDSHDWEAKLYDLAVRAAGR